MEAPSSQSQVGQELKQHTGRLVELGRDLLKFHHKDPELNPDAGRQERVKIVAGDDRIREDTYFDQSIPEDGTGRSVLIQYVKRTEQPEHPLPGDEAVISRIDRLQFELSDKLRWFVFGLGFEKSPEKDDSGFELTEVMTKDDLSGTNKLHLTGEAASRQAHIFKDSEIIAAMEAVTREIIKILEQSTITPWARAEILSPLHRLLKAKKRGAKSWFSAVTEAFR